MNTANSVTPVEQTDVNTKIYGRLAYRTEDGRFIIELRDGSFYFTRDDLEAAFFTRFVSSIHEMTLLYQPEMIVVQMSPEDALRLSWMFQNLSDYTIYDGKGPEYFECVGLRLGRGILPIRLRVYKDDRRELVVVPRNQVADD